MNLGKKINLIKKIKYNKFIKKKSNKNLNGEQYDPRKMIKASGEFHCGQFRVFPIEQGNNNSMSYIVFGSSPMKWNS